MINYEKFIDNEDVKYIKINSYIDITLKKKILILNCFKI